MKKILVIPSIIIFILAVISGSFLYYQLKVPVGRSSQDRFFEVEEGESTLAIADHLAEKDFIRSPWFFALYARWVKINLLPGLYYLRSNMSLLEIIDRISKGNVQEYKITIPEGWTIKQIAEYLDSRKIVGKDDFISATNGLEGYLFPDTYRIAVKSTSQDIIEKMRKNFAQRTEGLKIDRETIILASIVEKEAKTSEDRKIIAGIYQKRLELGMFLESCPTVLYAMGVQKDRLSIEDTKFDSPYNTYLHKGLPPGPICNPGLESIKAVLEPTESDYLYFLSDKDGNLHYAKTAEGHAANKEKYEL